MNIILFGFKGCGKTHYGRRLSKLLHRPFIDTDHLIEARHPGLTVRQIHETLGEAAFRAEEAEVILGLVDTKHSIIAVGGGAVLIPRNVEMLQRLGKMIYLDVSLETVIKRGVSLSLGPLEPIYRARKPIYESIPAYRISVDGL